MTQHHETTDTSHDSAGRHRERRMYLRFAAMITTSTVVMFVLTYSNTYAWQHVRWSEERFYMAVLMGGAMALVMLAFMRSMMYRNDRLNLLVVGVALALVATGYTLSRSQALVDDTAYMRGMVPHHSIAILTSERAGIDDVRVRELADSIIATQREEIQQMDWLIRDIEENGVAATQEEAEARPVPDVEGSAVADRLGQQVAAVLRVLGFRAGEDVPAREW